jgi:hypothetical protein
VVVGGAYQGDVMPRIPEAGQIGQDREMRVPAAHEEKVLSHVLDMRQSAQEGKREMRGAGERGERAMKRPAKKMRAFSRYCSGQTSSFHGKARRAFPKIAV